MIETGNDIDGKSPRNQLASRDGIDAACAEVEDFLVADL